MEIVGAFVHEINWRHPELYILINGAAPGLEGFAFEQRDQMFVAERDGVVRYYWEAPDDGTGYGFITIPMRDGTQRPLKRAWSSRPGCVNLYFPERPVIGVVVGQHEDRDYKPGWTAGYALTVERAREVLARHLPGWILEPFNDGEPTWQPRPTPGAAPPSQERNPLLRNS